MITFCAGDELLTGLILNLELNKVSAVVLDKDTNIKPVNMYLENMN
jgi:hypothetical protein